MRLIGVLYDVTLLPGPTFSFYEERECNIKACTESLIYSYGKCVLLASSVQLYIFNMVQITFWLLILIADA